MLLTNIILRLNKLGVMVIFRPDINCRYTNIVFKYKDLYTEATSDGSDLEHCFFVCLEALNFPGKEKILGELK